MRSSRPVRAIGLFAVGVFLTVLAVSSVAAADAPIALDKWGRYHTHVWLVTRMEKAKRYVWQPQIKLVFKATSPESDDVAVVQFFRGRAKWGKPVNCAIPSRGIIKRKKKGKLAGYSLVTLTCTPTQLGWQNKGGKFAFSVSYKKTGEGKVYKNLARYAFTVKPHTQIWNSKGKMKGWHVDYDFRLGESWVYYHGDGPVQLWSWFKVDHDKVAPPRGGKLRCFVGGKKMPFMGPTARTSPNYTYMKKRQGGRAHKVEWGLWYWFAPRVEGKMAQDWLKERGAGKVRCTLTQGGNITREFHFALGADGRLVKPACQTSGLVRALDDETLIRMVVKHKGGDMPYDRKAFAGGGLFGRKLPKNCP